MAAQKGPDQKCVRQITPAWPQSYTQPLAVAAGCPSQPYSPNYPTHFQPQRSRGTPGPCFNCGEMGHLRATCPKRRRLYPFNKYVQYADGGCPDSGGKGHHALGVNDSAKVTAVSAQQQSVDAGGINNRPFQDSDRCHRPPSW